MKADMLKDNTTYNIVKKSPFKKAERELNAILFDLKNQQNLTRRPIVDTVPPTVYHQPSEDRLNTTKTAIL